MFGLFYHGGSREYPALRGDAANRMQQAGRDDSEPGGVIAAIWFGIAGLSLAAVVIAWNLGPAPTREPVDLATTATGMAVMSTDVAANSKRSDLGGPDPETMAEISRLRSENQALRQSLETLRARIEIMSDKIATIDSRFSEVTGSISRNPPPANRFDALTPDVSITPNDVAVQEIPVTQTQFGVELGSFADLSTVKKSWRELRENQPGLFQDLNALASVRERAGKTELVLVAGPFPNAADAANRCALIDSAGLACLPAFYLGQSLSGG